MDRLHSLDPVLIARFAQDLRRLAGGACRIGIAVSGGPDSLALLLLAHAAAPGCVEAATVDHGLRAESAAEAAFVARLCADMGVPHCVLTVEVGAGSLQAAAREARYAALADWAADRSLACVATAHHADDQAETLLMRLNRGSGAAGLAGIRAKGTAAGGRLALVRPVLGWRRAELAALVSAAGIQAVDDPSNCDTRFDRVRLRRALRDCDWLDVSALAASAAHLADADEALAWATERVMTDHVAWDNERALLRAGLPKALALRAMAAIIARLSGGVPRGGTLARAYAVLSEGTAVTLGGVLIQPQVESWEFVREGNRRQSG